MIANPDKFQAILARKDKQCTEGLPVKIGSKIIKTENQVKLVGLLIDNKLSFDSYITTTLKQASAKLNAIKRIGKYLSESQKKILCYSYVLVYLKYCPAVWHFGNAGLIHKTEKLQKRVVRFINSDYDTDYFTLLKEKNLKTLYTERLENICCEVYKFKKGISPEYMNEIISERPSNYPSRNPLDIYNPKSNQVTFGYNSFRKTAPLVWNTLPNEIQNATSLTEFKTKIRNINLPWCSCKKCCSLRLLID